MKIVKKVLKLIAVLFGIFLVFIAIVIFVDSQNTNYLKVENNEFGKNTYLITNANIIPMNQDTILVDKMVYIKNGLIQKISKILRSRMLKLLMHKTNI